MAPDLYRTRVHKFSSKPPGHDAARQRENQRRHRARVKGRIAELESALESTQNRLDNALKLIESLAGQVQRLQSALDSAPQQRTVTPSPQTPTLESAPVSTPGSDLESSHRSNHPVATEVPILGADETRQEQVPPGAGSCCQAEGNHLGPGPCTSPTVGGDSVLPAAHHSQLDNIHDTINNTISEASFDNPNDDCLGLPAPSQGESTMPCRDAYLIIKDRSTPEFDLSDATEWLKPGFRRAIVPGTGCRVQTHALFAFVDRMTPL